MLKEQADFAQLVVLQEAFNITFFQDTDIWQYKASHDSKLCMHCDFYSDMYFHGDSLLERFPYLIIDGVDRISPQTHPNCRCSLSREPNL